MAKTYVLYNPLAGNNTCEDTSKRLKNLLKNEELVFTNSCEASFDMEVFFNRLEMDDKVVLCGGDGTINYLINRIDTEILENELYYYPAGSGNDFYNDVLDGETGELILLNKYLKNLPYVEVNGNKRKFINGVGFGIDGYCCEEGDIKREKKPGKPVNYSIIALKGLAFGFKCTNAQITIDDTTYHYSDVWMVPSMHGRFYGGGMKCAPNQDRLNCNNKVSVLVVHSKSRLMLLFAFATIFKGNHLKFKNIVTELKGADVRVVFDRPTALQIDGETYSKVREYRVYRG